MKPGDVVRVRSGGPLMTVGFVADYSNGHKSAGCAWFLQDEDGTWGSLHEHEFSQDVLEVVEED